MRKATYTMIAASVTLALAGGANALVSRVGVPTPATVAKPAATNTTANGTTTGTTTTTTGTGTTTTGTTTTTTGNGSTTVSSTTTSGTTGTTTGTTGTTGTTSGNVTFAPTGSTSGVSQVGTSTGSALVDAQNANLSAQFDTRGSATGAQSATTATSSLNGVGVGTSPSTTTTTNGGNVFGGGGGLVVTDNGTGTAGIVGGVNANGERVGVQADMSSLSPNAVEAPAIAVQAAPANITAAEVNVMERRELNKRRNLRRDRQLLYSIAPRTGVDRSDQAPNDPISPALTPPR